MSTEEGVQLFERIFEERLEKVRRAEGQVDRISSSDLVDETIGLWRAQSVDVKQWNIPLF